MITIEIVILYKYVPTLLITQILITIQILIFVITTIIILSIGKQITI